MHAERSNGLELFDQFVGALDQPALGDLERERRWRCTSVAQHLADGLFEIELAELTRGQVDANPCWCGRWPALLPFAGLPTGFPQDPAAQWVDQPCLLGVRNELVSANQAALGVSPANQGFKTLELARSKRHDGLVVQFELVAVQCAA